MVSYCSNKNLSVVDASDASNGDMNDELNNSNYVQSARESRFVQSDEEDMPCLTPDESKLSEPLDDRFGGVQPIVDIDNGKP